MENKQKYCVILKRHPDGSGQDPQPMMLADLNGEPILSTSIKVITGVVSQLSQCGFIPDNWEPGLAPYNANPSGLILAKAGDI